MRDLFVMFVTAVCFLFLLKLTKNKSFYNVTLNFQVFGSRIRRNPFFETCPGGPRDEANRLSIIFFWWMNDVLKLGNKQPLTEEDLFHLPEDSRGGSREVLARRIKKELEVNPGERNRVYGKHWSALFSGNQVLF